jgi:hypothetical protein
MYSRPIVTGHPILHKLSRRRVEVPSPLNTLMAKKAMKGKAKAKPAPRKLPRAGIAGSVGLASTFVASRATYINRSAAPFSPKFGEGVRVTGRQYLTSIITSSTTNLLFSGNSPAGNNTILVSPDAFNGRLALEARTFQRYLFTKLRLIYTPRVATTQAGEMCLAYYADGAATAFFTASFAAVQDSDKAVVTSFHNGGKQLIWDIQVPTGAQDSYYCEYDSTSSASIRQSVQGLLLGWPDVTSIGDITMGNLSVEYEVLLYCPTSDLGFTLMLPRIRSQEEAELVSATIAAFRKSRASRAEEDDTVIIYPGAAGASRPKGGGLQR